MEPIGDVAIDIDDRAIVEKREQTQNWVSCGKLHQDLIPNLIVVFIFTQE